MLSDVIVLPAQFAGFLIVDLSKMHQTLLTGTFTVYPQSTQEVRNACILKVQPTRCNVSQFIYFCKTLYMFQTVFPSGAQNCTYSVRYLSDRLKHVERLTEINKFGKRCILLFVLREYTSEC